MMQRLKALVLLGALVMAPLEAAAQATVELSGRTFWLGEQPPYWDEDQSFIGIRRFEWIEDVIGIDPILEDAVVHFEVASTYSMETLFEPEPRSVPLPPERHGAEYLIPGYRVFAPPLETSATFDYFPEDTTLGYSVRCSLTRDRQDFLLCVVFATYEGDTNIRLKARLYSVPPPAENPTHFRDVVDRMREVASCLDVTNERFVRTTPPPLSDCDAHTS